MELQLHERLAGTVATIESGHSAGELLEQLREALKAGGEVRQVALVRVLDADRLAPALDLNQALVDTMRQPPEPLTERAEIPNQIKAPPAAQISAGVNTHALQLLRRHPADTMELGDRQSEYEVVHLIRGNHEQTVRLVPIAGDLRQKLVGRNACRHRDAQLLPDSPADVLSDTRGTAGKMLAATHIEKGFVERQGFDEIGVGSKDPVDFAGRFLIGIHPGPHNQQIRTELQRMTGGHRRANAVCASFVVAGCNHAAPISQATDRYGPVGEAGIVPHFDRGIEAIAIDMDDFSGRANGRKLVSGLKRRASCTRSSRAKRAARHYGRSGRRRGYGGDERISEAST